MLDLATGAVTPLWPIDFSHTAIGLHISGRALNRPGWAVISTHDGDPASYTWMDDQVFIIELQPSGRVVLAANIKRGDYKVHNGDKWDPSKWPSEAKGFGFLSTKGEIKMAGYPLNKRATARDRPYPCPRGRPQGIAPTPDY